MASVVTDTKNGFLVIKLSEQLKTGRNYILHIGFEGVLSEGLAGYYRSSYHDQATNSTKYVTGG